jgi:Polysaccharide deacetylase
VPRIVNQRMRDPRDVPNAELAVVGVDPPRRATLNDRRVGQQRRQHHGARDGDCPLAPRALRHRDAGVDESRHARMICWRRHSMPRVPTGAPFEERGGRLRGALDLIAGRYPRFVFGGRVGDILPVFHFHESTVASLEPAFAYLADNGYCTVVSDEAASFARGGPHPGARSVMLAFDDAWASLWLVVGPLLQKYGLRAVTYTVPARVEEAATVRPTIDDGPVDAAGADRAEHPFVTWPELKALSTSGLVDVQSHTWSHSMIFSGDVVIGRVDAELANEPMLNRPRIDDGSMLEFVTPDRIGFPLLQRRSRMSDARRFFPDPEACARLEVSAGTETRMLPFAGKLKGRWETVDEQARAIDTELAASRDTLQSRLGTAVHHICLPWGVSGTLTRRALERTGFLSAFANKLSGRFAVASGDDPYYLKRLNGRHVFALPGRGRVIGV